MLQQRPRIRILYGGCVAMLAVLSVAVIHELIAPYGYVLMTRVPGRHIDFGLSSGSLWASCTEYQGTGIHATVQPIPRAPWRWSPLEYENVINVYGARQIVLRISLWPLWLLVAGPTAWLWFAYLRHKPGHCRCGYDLTGCASAKCPECGRDTSRASAKSPLISR